MYINMFVFISGIFEIQEMEQHLNKEICEDMLGNFLYYIRYIPKMFFLDPLHGFTAPLNG